MPIYEYECLTCGIRFDKRQSFNDEPKATCPNGHPDTRRLIATPAIVFKGSGFYVNDSKAKNSANGFPPSKKEKDAEDKPSTAEKPNAETKSEKNKTPA